MANRSIPQIEAPVIITLKRTQYTIRNKLTWRQRIIGRFHEGIVLAAIAVTVAAIIVSAATPALLPIPA